MADNSMADHPIADYQPLDLSPLCNAGLDVLDEKPDAPIGDQAFRGLPFRINDDPSNCFVVLDEASGSVTIPVHRTGAGLIVAHRLLESDLMEGGPLGIPVADYVFRIGGGGDSRDGENEDDHAGGSADIRNGGSADIRVPIRERFEIAHISQGGKPFVALPDHGPVRMRRYEGNWSDTGRRQTEVAGDYSRGYFLWAWRNPHPGREIESLQVIPAGPRFIIAGVTVSHVDEHPFVRQGKREARLILTDPEDAGKPFDLHVDVDRGIASYVHPLPEASTDDFIAGEFAGWGEAQNPKSSPAYVEVAAIPSATVTVKQGEETVGAVKWGDVERKKSVETPRMRVELLDRGRNWVRVTVLDDDTDRPVPCRVHFRSPEGIPYQPYGHHNQVNSNLDTWHIDVGGDLRLGQITYAYIDGKCQGWLPRGEVVVDVARGFEYEPIRTRVKIEPGQQELTLRLKRWVDMNAEGWYSGDSHVHFLSTQGSHTESMGEDLNIVNLLPSQWGNLFTNTEDFTGRPSISQDGNNIVYVGQENRQHFLGHLILWGLKEPVMPWCSDGPGEAELGGTLEITMSDWADQCHAQGGSVIIPHLPNPNGEPAALIATGRADGVEMLRHAPFNHIEYYRYLNCGYKLPLVGGTDKMSSDVPVGLYRTYAYMPDQDFTYDNWCAAVSRGRTFHSGGPIIHFTVDGRQVGDTVQMSGPGTAEVRAWAESIFPIHTLEIVQGGRVVASTEDRNGTRRLDLKAQVKVDGHTWMAARCAGPDYTSVSHHDGWGRGIFAHTSPIYVACGGDWWMFDRDAAQYMLTLIDGDLQYIRRTAARHEPGTATHHHGEEDHLAYLERPFVEAREAIHRRMHQLGIPH